jgi:hypothetical protein
MIGLGVLGNALFPKAEGKAPSEEAPAKKKSKKKTQASDD